MKTLSIFDIIGPNMIGPSSSHTAGALQIAKIAREDINDTITKATFIMYGSFARTYDGHGTDKALLGGILGYDTTDHRIKDAFANADASRLQYEFVADYDTEPDHPNTVDIIIETKSGNTIKVRGISTGGGDAEIISIER